MPDLKPPRHIPTLPLGVVQAGVEQGAASFAGAAAAISLSSLKGSTGRLQTFYNTESAR